MDRINPFGDLEDFAPKPRGRAHPVEPAAIDALAEQHGFPSREAARVPVAPAQASEPPVDATEKGAGSAPDEGRSDKAVQPQTDSEAGRRTRRPVQASTPIRSDPPSKPRPSPSLTPVARRRYTTGRNQQINVKATAATIALFYRLADERDVPLGELLEQALVSLQGQAKKG